MKKLFLCLSILLPIPVLTSHEGKFAVIVVKEKGEALRVTDSLQKQFPPENEKLLRFAVASVVYKVSRERSRLGFVVPLLPSELYTQYRNKCQDDSAPTQGCIELRKELEAEVQKFEKEALQESIKLREELGLSEGAHAHIAICSGVPEVTIVPIPEGATADANSATSANTTPAPTE